jgi:small subunit ribosomal protein S9
MSVTNEHTATGRRKNAIVKIWAKNGSGSIRVNERDFTEYFPSLSLQNDILRPLELTNSVHAFDLRVSTNGGGVHGQAGALRLALSRVLVEINPEFRPVLKKEGLLTRDPRMKERKKPGQPGARKRFQFSKR